MSRISGELVHTWLVRSFSPALVAFVVGVGTLFVAACSNASTAQCVRSTGSKICYMRDDAAGGSLNVSGLDPGSTLTVSSKEFGTAKYVVNGAGTLDGKVGFVHGTNSSVELTVTGTTGSKQALIGTFNS
ncbi:MAG: hypothetical protein JWM34_4435 [Ilumatobacteraceae bacterium]|nr:hypothetical protein [Ilumatobacteraceae bacterium]